MNIGRLVKKNVKSLTPYEAKEVTCRIKLDANESPYGFDGVLNNIRNIETNRYPDPEARALRKDLAKLWKVRAGNILHGNGSDELIYYLAATFGGPVLYPSPTFGMYGIISRVLNERTISVPLKKDFSLDKEKIFRMIKEKKPRLIFLSSPNNPTGNVFERDTIIEIIKKCRGVVVVDEAYHPFSSEKSFTGLLKDYPNLVVMKTLSKIGLAALRSGFIIANRDVINEVNKVRLPFNVNSLSQAAALEALKNYEKLNEIITAVQSERDGLFDILNGLEGVRPFPSEANFILFRVRRAGGIYRLLLKGGVLVRNMSDVIKDCLRVTIGKPEENAVFIKELKKALGNA